MSCFRCFISLGTVRVGGILSLQELNFPPPGRTPVWSKNCSEIFKDLKSGDNIFIHGASGTPCVLLPYLYQCIKITVFKSLNVLRLMPMGPQCLLNEDVRGNLGSLLH